MDNIQKVWLSFDAFYRLPMHRDTAGQERFRTLTTAYYRGAMGILLMYDVTSLESYNNLSYWLRNIQEVSMVSKAKWSASVCS